MEVLRVVLWGVVWRVMMRMGMELEGHISRVPWVFFIMYICSDIKSFCIHKHFESKLDPSHNHDARGF